MSDDLDYIHRKIDDIETNMATKSDIAHVSLRVDGFGEIADEIRNNSKVVANAVTDMMQQLAVNEEASKHKEKELERVAAIAEGAAKGVAEWRLVAAADKPFKDARSWAVKVMVGVATGAAITAMAVAITSS
ncbi:hypothetical protein N9895_02080 [Gammaproteobacteria bacterium]|nr:hypothetical protein [Gammaproteobacteria bacterium]